MLTSKKQYFHPVIFSIERLTCISVVFNDDDPSIKTKDTHNQPPKRSTLACRELRNVFESCQIRDFEELSSIGFDDWVESDQPVRELWPRTGMYQRKTALLYLKISIIARTIRAFSVIPVALKELRVSFCSWPIPKYVRSVSTGADNENINRCFLILFLESKKIHRVKIIAFICTI